MPSHTCAVCGKLFTYESIQSHGHFPFCSKRCKLIDLGRWLDERYVIPGSDEDDRTGEKEEETE